jgi:hypothetical protein
LALIDAVWERELSGKLAKTTLRNTILDLGLLFASFVCLGDRRAFVGVVLSLV